MDFRMDSSKKNGQTDADGGNQEHKRTTIKKKKSNPVSYPLCLVWRENLLEMR